MGASVPLVKLVGDVLLAEDLAKVFVVAKKRVFAANRENDIHFSEILKTFPARQVWEKVSRGMEVNVVIVVPAEEVSEDFDLVGEIVATGEGGQFDESFGMAKGDAGGEKGPEGAAVGDGGGSGVELFHEGEDLAKDVFLVLPVPVDPSGGMGPPAVEGFSGAVIDAEELEVTGLDFVAEGFRHPHAFVFIAIPVASRKDENPRSGVAVDDDIKIAV